MFLFFVSVLFFCFVFFSFFREELDCCFCFDLRLHQPGLWLHQPVNCLFLIFAAVAGIRWWLAATTQVNCCFCFPFLFLLHRLVVVLLLLRLPSVCRMVLPPATTRGLRPQPGTSGHNQGPLATTRDLRLQPGTTPTGNLLPSTIPPEMFPLGTFPPGTKFQEALGLFMQVG